MLRNTLAVVIALVLLAVPMLALAQEELTETYTTSDGSLSFMYPAGWVTDASGSQVAITNSQEFADTGDFDAVPPGTVAAVIVAGPWDESAGIDLSGDLSAMTIGEYIASDPTAAQITEGPVPLDIAPDAAMLIGVEGSSDVLIVVSVMNGEDVIILICATAQGELDMFQETLIAIAGSATYAPPDPTAGTVAEDSGPAAVAGTGAVAWQQQRPNTFDDTGFGSLGAVAVAEDGTIYIADGFNGIRVLDADGNVTGTITNNTISNIDDMELADDGTLWLIDGFEGMVFNLATDGTLLSSFGEQGSGPGQFGEFSPGSFDTGPDGSLYFFDSQALSDTESIGRIQVFDTAGTFIREFPTDPNGEGNLASFVNIAVAPDGNIYASGFFSGMTIFDPQGNILDDNYGEASFQLNVPQDFDFSSEGLMYAATNDGLFVLNETGAVTAQFGMRQESDSDEAPPLEPGEFYSVSGLGVAPNGDAIIADTNFEHSQVVRISLEDLSAPPTGAGPGGEPEATDAVEAVPATPTAVPETDESSEGSLADAIQGGDDAPAAPGDELRQWASGATATSEYTDTSWSALQATGAPNTTQCGDISTAWASSSSTSVDALTVTYDQAVIPTQINIHQTYNPGSITGVAVIPADGSAPVDLPNSADPPNNTPCPGVFTLTVTGQTAPVNGVVIYVDQSIVGNWDQIDAVELVGTAQ